MLNIEDRVNVRRVRPITRGILDPRTFFQTDMIQIFLWALGTIILYWFAINETLGPWIVVSGLLIVTLFGIAADMLKDLRALFRARNLVLLFVFYMVLLDVVLSSPELEELPIGLQLWASAHYCLFVTLWLASYAMTRGMRMGEWIGKKFNSPANGRTLFLAVVFIFVAEMVRRLAFVDWNLNRLWEETLFGRSGPVSFGRGRFGDWRVFLEPFEWVFGYIPILVAFAWDYVKGFTRRIVMICCVLLVLTFLFFGGSRGVFVIPIITILSYRLLISPPGRRLRWVVIMIIVSFAMAPLMDLMVRYRVIGWRSEQITFQEVAFSPLEAKRDTNFSAMAQMMEIVKEEGHRSVLEFYYYMAIAPVPRVLWPAKPYMSQDYLGDYRKDYASMSSVGDMYMYGGVIHVIIGALVFGWFVNSLDRFLVWAVLRREWTFIYTLLVWLAITYLRAIWSVVVQLEWLFAFLSIFWLFNRLKARRTIRGSR